MLLPSSRLSVEDRDVAEALLLICIDQCFAFAAEEHEAVFKDIHRKPGSAFWHKLRGVSDLTPVACAQVQHSHVVVKLSSKSAKDVQVVAHNRHAAAFPRVRVDASSVEHRVPVAVQKATVVKTFFHGLQLLHQLHLLLGKIVLLQLLVVQVDDQCDPS